MKKSVRILMVDDHPITLDGYKNILTSYKDHDLELNIKFAYDCEQAYLSIIDSVKSHLYDIIFLDISLPSSPKFNLYSGEDLGLKIRELSPNSDIIILTMHTENFRIYNILKNISPEGFLIKSDVTTKEFFTAFIEVLNNKSYYSNSVRELMRKQFTNKLTLDQLDRNILHYLSKGYKTNELTGVIPLSLPAIEKRKRNIKESFSIVGNDLILIEKARELGFI